MTFAQVTALDTDAVGVPVVIASLVLVAMAIAVSRWLGIGVEAEITWASIRAAAQLIAVGILLNTIVGSSLRMWLAWAWVAMMVTIATRTVVRRAKVGLPSLTVAAALATGGSVLMSQLVVFTFGIFDYTAINVIVVAGITIGNALPSAVLAANQVGQGARSRIGEIEALLALGFDRNGVTMQLAPVAAKSALIPQVERTKVVGLIALPGAMVGLLLAGAEPIEAVVVQLLVMYLVLGSVAISVLAIVASMARNAITSDLRVADWVRPEADE